MSMGSPSVRVVLADDELLARERLRELLRAESEFHLVAEACDGPAAVRIIREHHPHIVLLDIRLPGMDGFEVIEQLRDESAFAVIFVTAYRDHAVRAFDAEAVDYLLKPFTAERLRDALHRARKRVEQRPSFSMLHLLEQSAATPAMISLKCGLRTRLVALTEIQYVTAANTHCQVVTQNHVFDVSESLGALEKRLPRREFARISRFALVNLDHVVSIQPKTHGDQILTLKNGRQMIATRTQRRGLLSRLGR